MIQIADALAKIHSKNIVHRDLKPDNIMLIENKGDPNFVKLLDFGLARTQYQTRLTQTGIVIGTISYLSPEQISGKRSGAASDIYALGTIFYEMLTGEKPFIGETTTDIMKQILEKTPIEPLHFRDDIPRELNHLILRMLEKEIKSRPIIFDVLAYLQGIEVNLGKQDAG
jgi:serine/threonine-protein kinase